MTKVQELFGKYIVRKEVVNEYEINRLPRFIAEYLISKFSNNGELSEDGIKKVSKFVNMHYPELKDKDKILYNLMVNGNYTIIDEFKVEVDIKQGKKRLIIPCLNIRDAEILDNILEDNQDLLRSGMWGIATLKYIGDNSNSKNTPILMTKFTPFQVGNVELEDFISKRSEFTMDEWIDLIIKSIGLNPKVYSMDEKMLLLLRLVPLVEPNTHIMELGPKATGKTYLYRNISYYTRIISGGRVGAATLFYNINTKVIGEIGIKDAVIFDEIDKLTFSNSEEVISKLKDYMVDGFFERGPKKAHATCSLVFTGNTDSYDISDIGSNLPEFMIDSALLDRINGFIPGWKLPKIKSSSEHLASGYGIVADYFAEILHKMRFENYNSFISEHIRLENVTIRDEKSIKKVLSGLLKLLCVNRENYDRYELALCLDTAVSVRNNIREILNSITPDEFPKNEIKYSCKHTL